MTGLPAPRRTARSLAILLAALLALPALSEAETVALPGTGLSLNAPQGFEIAEAFAGLQNRRTGASVLVATLPAEAAGELGEIFASFEAVKAAFAEKGVAISEQVTLDPGVSAHPAYRGTQTVGEITAEKWIALYVEDRVVIVTYQAPQLFADDRATVEAILNSVEISAPPGLEEKLALLPYEVRDLAGFAVRDVMANSGLVLTEDGGRAGPDKAIVIVAPSLGEWKAPKAVHLHASRRMVRGIATYEDISIASEEPAELMGLEGWRIEVTATRPEDDTEIRGVQWTGFSETGYVRVWAAGPQSSWEENLPRFERIARSLVARRG